MELKILSRAGDEIHLSDQLPASYDHLRLTGSTPVSTTSPFGNMLFQHYPGSGFDIWYSTYDITCPVTLIGRADIPVLELHIPIQNRLSASWDGIVHEEIAEKQFDLSYTPFVQNEMFFARKGVHQTFDVHYHKSTLQQFAPHFPLLSLFLEDVEKGLPASLFGTTRFITPAMERIIHDMRHCRFMDTLTPAFYECKAMELLIEVLHNLSGITVPCEKFSKAALEYAQAAQILLSKDLDHIYTAEDLARKVGTNVYTLNHTFKHLFNTSLFKYGEQVRMEHARQLLLDTDHTVSEVAWKVGYPDSQNFATAFKRHFHVRPGDIRGRK